MELIGNLSIKLRQLVMLQWLFSLQKPIKIAKGIVKWQGLKFAWGYIPTQNTTVAQQALKMFALSQAKRNSSFVWNITQGRSQ